MAVGAIGIAAALVATTASGATMGLQEKVQELANAIAYAEGYFDRDGNILFGNVPARFHNPGDLGPGDAPAYAWHYEGGSQVVEFPDDATGWSYLLAKVSRMLAGTSRTYSLDDTITQVAQKYAGDWFNWAANVSNYLGVNPSITLRDWLRT